MLFLILFIDKYIRGGDYFSGNSAAPVRAAGSKGKGSRGKKAD